MEQKYFVTAVSGNLSFWEQFKSCSKPKETEEGDKNKNFC